MSNLLSVDFHCHIYAFKDSLTLPADLISAAHRKGIDRVVITEHNTIEGVREAQAIDLELSLLVKRS